MFNCLYLCQFIELFRANLVIGTLFIFRTALIRIVVKIALSFTKTNEFFTLRSYIRVYFTVVQSQLLHVNKQTKSDNQKSAFIFEKVIHFTM